MYIRKKKKIPPLLAAVVPVGTGSTAAVYTLDAMQTPVVGFAGSIILGEASQTKRRGIFSPRIHAVLLCTAAVHQ